MNNLKPDCASSIDARNSIGGKRRFRSRLTIYSTAIAVMFLVMFDGYNAPQAIADEAALSAPLVQTDSGNQTDITVYGRSFAQIEETRTVTLQAGPNRIQLNGISSQYTPDSLRLIETKGPGTFTYNSATYQPANLNRDQILKKSIGETVSVTVGSGANTQTVVGKLLSVASGQLIVVDPSGKTYMTSSHNVALDKLPEGLSNTASLIVEANVDTAGDYEIRFFYESRGLSWTAKHSMIFNEEANRVDDLQTTVNVVNNSGTTFNGANLWLLSGDVPQNAKNASRGSSYRIQQMDESSSASVESVGERKVYKIPGRIDLVAGQSRQIPLYSAQNVPVEKEFVLTSWDYQFRNAQGLVPVKVQLNMKNCVLSNLGTPLPAAMVKVYQANSSGNLQLTATTSLKELAVDEAFIVDLGNSSDVKASVKLVKSQDLDDTGSLISGQLRPNYKGPKFRYQEWLIKVHNFKLGSDVDVAVKAQIPNNLDNVSPFTRESATIGTANVKVLRTDSTELHYNFKVQIN